VVNSKVMVVAVAVLFIVVLFILCLHIYAKWFWRNHATATIVTSDGTVHTLSWRRRRSAFVHNPADAPPHSVGLERSVVESLPTFEFSGEGRKLECAVCLEDFEQGEQGRTLPKCGHDFHLECIDMWLHSHSTCPLCRTGVAADSKSPEPIGAPFMAAMRASRQRQRSLSRTAEPEQSSAPETIRAPEELSKENETSSSGSGIRAPFEVTIDIPRGGVNPASVMSPMARASASFRRLLSRGKSVVTPQSDDVGPSSSPPSPPPPPPPSV
jgi:hypothetical protein